ncbi:MAG: prolyl oligopeptidase family serine peptidase [Acidobacteriota bacterium]|nr:MAG: prolyl oligopeptidase family serine peptidase [Acidobacteriota bacterium]
MLKISSSITLVLLLSFGLLQAGPSFTLEEVLSAPFPSDLTAAPVGEKVAWVFDAQGKRNVWLAEGPDFQARRLTEFLEDDGQELSGLEWAPDGTKIVFTRGGNANAKGEIPNPVFDPDGAAQEVWIVDARSGDSRKLTDGRDPVFSPDGQSVLYVSRGQVWQVSLDSDGKASQMFKTRGSCRELSWSPDGKKLAFVSSRGSHSFIGLFEVGSRTLRYLDPAVDDDFSPVWSPDSQEIAFVRSAARTRNVVFGARRAGSPWSIRVVTLSTGLGREVWRADPGKGSVFRWVTGRQQLFWMVDGRLVFPWEKDGWTQLYSVPSAGGTAGPVTTGGFEVEEVRQSPDRKTLFICSNQDDIDRRHIWKITSTQEPPVRVTSGQGIEWAPAPVGTTGGLALLRADAFGPARPAVLQPNGEMRDVAAGEIPDGFPRGELVAPEQVRFPAADGLMLHGQLFVPRDLEAGEKRPAVIFFHGGSRRQMLLGWHYMYYYHNTYAFNQYLANQGYVVLSVNYRSGIGYGMEFREALDYGATGGSEYADVQGAGIYLRARPDVDGARIGLWGGSYGGYLTALGLARASDLFAAGVDLHGVHDWNLEWGKMTDGWDTGKEAEAREIAWESSPMAYVDTWRSPVLMIHGDDDRNVVFTQTIQLTEDLRARGVEVELLIFPDEVHDFLLHRNWLEAYAAAADFFNRHLWSAAALEGDR